MAQSKQASTLNVCKKCGGPNDLLADSCMFCKSALERIDTESISNEELIQTATEWIEKSHLRFIKTGKTYGNSKEIEIPNREIRGFASRYLSALSYRASRDPSLSSIYTDLNSRFGKIKPKLLQSNEAVVIVMIVGLFIVFFAILGPLSLREKAGPNKERDRINTVVAEVEALVLNEKYDEALFKSEQINWQASVLSIIKCRIKPFQLYS